MLTNEEATSLVNGIAFCVQKARSDLMEGIGTDDVAQSLLADLQPMLFGLNAILPKVLEWQDRCRATGKISGADLFNMFKWIDMSESRSILIGLKIYSYSDVDEADIAWFTHTWEYVPARFPSARFPSGNP
jgi:hypothetical protein